MLANTKAPADSPLPPPTPEAEAAPAPDNHPLPAPLAVIGHTPGQALGGTVGTDRPDGGPWGGAAYAARAEGWPEHQAMSGVSGVIAAGPTMAGPDLAQLAWGDMLRTARLQPSHPWDAGAGLGLLPPADPDAA